MKKRALTQGLLLFLLPVLLLAQEKPTEDPRINYVALVVQMKGDIQVQRNDSKKVETVMWGNYLYQGDRITTGKNSQVSILFSNGIMVDVEAGSAFTISNHPGAEPNSPTTKYNIRDKVIPDLDRLKMKELLIKRYQESFAADGSVRLSPSLRDVYRDTILIFPRKTTITNLQPTFRWQSLYQNATYEISLFNDGKLLWSYRVNQPKFTAPAPLEWGKSYQWQVKILKNLSPAGRLETSAFWTIEQKQRNEFLTLVQEVRKKNFGRVSEEYYNFLMAHTHLKYELRDEAIAYLKAIAQTNPNFAFPNEALCRLYGDKDLYYKVDTEYTRWQQALAQPINKRELAQ
jgi:hypothetical protein